MRRELFSSLRFHAEQWLEFSGVNEYNDSVDNIKALAEKRIKMRIVVKVGTSTLTHATGNLNIRRVDKLCRVLSDIKNSGHEVILVTSGAVGMGVGKLSLKERPKDIPSKQAVAAVGQCELMYTYDRAFSEHNHVIAQILLSAYDVENEERRHNFHNTIFRLLELGVLPVINENDTVATEELAIGDNDTLSAIVAVNAGADLLVLLSDIDGLYTADPHRDSSAKLLPEVHGVTPEIIALAGGAGSSLGTGGMATKLHAAQIVNDAGIDMIITNGADPDVLYKITDGESVGTRFMVR